jgi:hypothetical protein
MRSTDSEAVAEPADRPAAPPALDTEPRRGRRRPPRALLALVALVVVVGVLAAAFVARELLVSGPGVAGRLTAPVVAPSGAVLFAGAGDIASCGNEYDTRTGEYLAALAPETSIFTTGDNAYDRGTEREFADCYDPVWGPLRDRTYPVPGNHEYATTDAAPYFEYFGDRVGEPGRSWYAFDLNGWRVYALDSNCLVAEVCAEGAVEAQQEWLRADLAAHPARCIAALWHHPRFSSGRHGGLTAVQPLWEALTTAGADVALVGHDHLYERFVPLDANGSRDVAGLRQFVVGTGGKELYGFRMRDPRAEARDDATYGVLVLTLWPDRYDWRFVPTDGTFTDEGSATCS